MNFLLHFFKDTNVNTPHIYMYMWMHNDNDKDFFCISPFLHFSCLRI